MPYLAPEMFWTYLKWVVIAAIWGALAFGIYHEDRHIRRLPPGAATPPEITALLQMLHMRNIQMGVLLSLLLLVGAVTDIRYDLAALASRPATMPVAAQLPVATATAATPAPYEKALAKLRGGAQDVPFSDITEFNEKDSKRQAYIDWLKQRYEAWLVTYYYLQNCKKADPQDLVKIEGAMQNELTAAHADSTVASNILLAATGSYDEMYRDIPCDTAHVTATKATYDANMQQIQPSAQSGSAAAAHAGAAVTR